MFIFQEFTFRTSWRDIRTFETLKEAEKFRDEWENAISEDTKFFRKYRIIDSNNFIEEKNNTILL